MTSLVIIGAGDHGRVMADVAAAIGRSPIGFVQPPDADASAREVDGLPVLGRLGDSALTARLPADLEVCVAIGSNGARADAYEAALRLGWRAVSLVHPSAVLLGQSVIEAGSQVCAGAVIGVAAVILEDSIINTAASVDHDNRIGPHAFVGPGARLAGRVTVLEGAHVGIGATVREGCTIGARAYVAAGATVVQDVAPGMRVAGVPARPMDPAGAAPEEA